MHTNEGAAYFIQRNAFELTKNLLKSVWTSNALIIELFFICRVTSYYQGKDTCYGYCWFLLEGVLEVALAEEGMNSPCEGFTHRE